MVDNYSPERCEIHCVNNSTCARGDANRIVQSASYLALLNRHQFEEEKSTRNELYCYCHNGFSGTDCSVPVQSCSSASEDVPLMQCYFGGTCHESEDSCDCANALYEGYRYAGKYCETKVDDRYYCIGGANYCLNGGRCSRKGCRCSAKYYGDHCEFSLQETSSTCNLECQNGGTCELGRPEPSNDPVYLWDPLLMLPTATSDGGAYCKCADGYAGQLCESRAEICGDSEHLCLHGSSCVPIDGSKRQFTCECPESSATCNSRKIVYCKPLNNVDYFESVAVPSFCLNGGTCLERRVEGRYASGCQCPHTFYGDRCEFTGSPDHYQSKNNDTTKDDSRVSFAMFAGLVSVVVVAVVSYCFVMGCRWYMNRRRTKRNGVTMHMHNDQILQTSVNGNMLFPVSSNHERTGAHFPHPSGPNETINLHNLRHAGGNIDHHIFPTAFMDSFSSMNGSEEESFLDEDDM